MHGATGESRVSLLEGARTGPTPWRGRRGAAGRARRQEVAVTDGDLRTGLLVEIDSTATMFSNPSDERTENYITGRFG